MRAVNKLSYYSEVFQSNSYYALTENSENVHLVIVMLPQPHMMSAYGTDGYSDLFLGLDESVEGDAS